MMSDKELYELFRKSQYNFKDRPSPNTWNRLERRLDNHRAGHHRSSFRRTLSMVAALALLVVALFLLTITAGENSASPYAKPQFMEDLVLPSHTESDAKALVELSIQYRKHSQKSVAEGKTFKKLVPNPNTEILGD